jgi:putative nucleotidyltransferase with HDIG domain
MPLYLTSANDNSFMNPKNFLKEIPYISLITRIAQKRKTKVWLVGGFLRDIYLGIDKNLTDFDFCLEHNVTRFVREFSRAISSKFIVLNERQLTLRVILKRSSRTYTFDFAALRGKDIYQDLSLRDFSINTLAVNLNDRKSGIIDYFGAQKDLDRKVLKVVKEQVIEDDPLRILRGFSFMLNYTFRIEPKTEKTFVKYKALLKHVSRERINEELFKIFSAKQSHVAIKRMDELKILEEIIPRIRSLKGVFQGGYHHLDVWRHSLETLKSFELLYGKYLRKNKEVVDYLNEELAQNRKRIQIIKLGCILHDVGKPIAKRKKGKKTIFYAHEKIGRDMAEDIARDLRLSLREKEVLKKLIFWHLRPGYLADQAPPSGRAIYRFLRDTETEGVAVILLSLSDWRATRGPLTNAKKRKKHEKVMLGLVRHYFEGKKKKPLPKLVDGYDIMRKFSLKPSPLIGRILRKIKEEQALGKIRTKAQSYLVAKKLVHSFRGHISKGITKGG